MRQGHQPEAKREYDITVGLMKSVTGGKDGQTAASAFNVITVGEEYALMMVMQYQVAGQALVNENGHAYDVLTASKAGGDPRKFYFLIDSVMAGEAKALELPPRQGG